MFTLRFGAHHQIHYILFDGIAIACVERGVKLKVAAAAAAAMKRDFGNERNCMQLNIIQISLEARTL